MKRFSTIFFHLCILSCLTLHTAQQSHDDQDWNEVISPQVEENPSKKTGYWYPGKKIISLFKTKAHQEPTTYQLPIKTTLENTATQNIKSPSPQITQDPEDERLSIIEFRKSSSLERLAQAAQTVSEKKYNTTEPSTVHKEEIEPSKESAENLPIKLSLIIPTPQSTSTDAKSLQVDEIASITPTTTRTIDTNSPQMKSPCFPQKPSAQGSPIELNKCFSRGSITELRQNNQKISGVEHVDQMLAASEALHLEILIRRAHEERVKKFAESNSTITNPIYPLSYQRQPITQNRYTTTTCQSENNNENSFLNDFSLIDLCLSCCTCYKAQDAEEIQSSKKKNRLTPSN